MKKIDKYLDFAWELKKLKNMTITVVPIVVSALGMVPKVLKKKLEELKIRERIKTIQTIAMLRLVRIPRSVQVIWGDLLSIRLQWKTSRISWREKLSRNEIIIIIIIIILWKKTQLYGYFKWQTKKIAHVMTWKWQGRGHLKREAESLLIAAQINAIRMNYMKAKTNYVQQNSLCWSCGDRDETVNYIISECSKLAMITNGICTNQNLSKKMKCIKFSLRYKQITQS